MSSNQLNNSRSLFSPSFFLVIFLFAITLAAFSADNLTGFTVAPSSQQITPGVSCSDADGGKAYYQASLVQSFDSALTMQRDSCKNDHTLIEWYCSGNTAQQEEVACQTGCVAGACRRPNVNANQGMSSPRPENVRAIPEEQPKQARLAGSNAPSATVDTSDAGGSVSLATPTFTVQQSSSSSSQASSRSSSQQSQENERRQQAACVRRCESGARRCSNDCLGGNPFTSPLCITDCARAYGRCERRC